MKSIQAILDLKKPHWQYDYNKIHGDIRYRWLFLNYEAVAQLLLSLTLQIVDLPSPGPGFMPMEDIILIAIFSLQGWPRTQDLFIQDWSLFTAILIGANEYAAIQIIYSEETWYWLDVFGKKTCGEVGKPINKSFPTLPDMVSAKARTHRSLPSRYGYGMKCCSPQDMDYYGFSDLQNGPKLIYPPAIKHGNGKYPIYIYIMYIDFPIKTFIYVGFAKLPCLITAGM